MDMSINGSGAVAAPKTDDEIFKDILKWGKVAVSSLSVVIYAVERGIRYGEIPTDLSGVDPALNANGPVERFKEKLALPVQLIKALSYGVTALTYFEKIFEYIDKTGNEVVFLGVTLTRNTRRVIVFIVIACVAIPMGLLYYKTLHSKVSGAAKRWTKPISVVTNMGKTFYGIYQIIFLLKHQEIFEGDKLFVISNIANNFTSFTEMWGLDVVFYEADLGVAAGAGYICVYSVRSVIKAGEVVGLAIAD